MLSDLQAVYSRNHPNDDLIGVIEYFAKNEMTRDRSLDGLPPYMIFKRSQELKAEREAAEALAEQDPEAAERAAKQRDAEEKRAAAEAALAAAEEAKQVAEAAAAEAAEAARLAAEKAQAAAEAAALAEEEE